jgi:hypothetical protein
MGGDSVIIKRTERANQPRAIEWVHDPYGWQSGAPYAGQAVCNEYPTHSNLLGPNGSPLQYEPRDPVGFDLRRKR